MIGRRMCDFFTTILIAGVVYSGCLSPDLGPTSAEAQNPTCTTRPTGDSSNACASTAFVNANSSGGTIIAGLVNDAYQSTTSITTVASSTSVTITGGVGPCILGKAIVIPNVGTISVGGTTTDYGRLTATISGISGNTITLSAAPTRSLTQTIRFTCGTDNTTAVQTAITNNANSVFPVGANALIISDIIIPSSRGITIPNRASVYSAGRFTAAASGISDVNWRIDGVLQSLGMVDGPDLLLGWASFGGYAERGFVEFGGKSTGIGGTSGNNFSVIGNGKVCGEFTGTPNFTNQGWQNNRKGIGAWFASNVKVTVNEVCGFQGEAVYYSTGVTTDKGVLFSGMYVHDTRMNGPNLNIAASIADSNGFIISNNVVYNAFTCYEFDAGTVTGNRCDTFFYAGYTTGLGSGTGPITITGNTARNGTFTPDAVNNVCGVAGQASVGFCLSFANTAGFTPPKNMVVAGNAVDTVGGGCYVMNAGTGATKISNVVLNANTCRNYANGSAAYGFSFQKVDYLSGYGNTTTDPGASNLGTWVGGTNTNLMFAPNTPPTTAALQVYNNTDIATWLAPGATSGIPVISNGTTFVVGQTANAGLVNSTISGISLGSNLGTLTFGTHLTTGGTSYNGSTGVTITSDAVATNTASTIMARDGSGQVAATTFTGALAGNASTATTTNQINGVDQTAAWTTTGGPTCKDNAGVAFAASSSAWRYRVIGKTVHYAVNCTITNVAGASNGVLQISLPFTAANTGGNANYFATGWNSTGGKLAFGQIGSAASFISVSYVTGAPSASTSIAFANTDVFLLSGTYETQ